MKVVINNWREDGEKEAVDDWGGITMCSLIHAALHTRVLGCDVMWVISIHYGRVELWWKNKKCRGNQSIV